MTQDEDDDLPVLTQVLRTGTAPPGAARGTALGAPVSDRATDDTLMADELVIGNAPHDRIDDYLAVPATIDHDEPEPHAAEVGHDDAPFHPSGADVFRLPQDHDGARGTTAVMQEPEILPVQHDVPHAASTVEAPMHEDPAAFALRIRESVLERLASRIDTELDARIAQAMHAEVETALAQLQGRLREHLSEALRDVVRRAVDDEIARSGAPRADGT